MGLRRADGRSTLTCLVGCWCSHHPLASCRLWGRREVADTPRGSYSLAHSATESLTHQWGREGGRKEDGGWHLNNAIYTFQVSIHKDHSPKPCKALDCGAAHLSHSVVHHWKPHYLAQRQHVYGKKVNGSHYRVPSVWLSKLCPHNRTLEHVLIWVNSLTPFIQGPPELYI